MPGELRQSVNTKKGFPGLSGQRGPLCQHMWWSCPGHCKQPDATALGTVTMERGELGASIIMEAKWPSRLQGREAEEVPPNNVSTPPCQEKWKPAQVLSLTLWGFE